MNLGSFSWNLNYGSKKEKNYDQNSSLLTEYDSPPLSPQENLASKSSTVLFNNDNGFEEIFEKADNDSPRNKAFISNETKQQASQDEILLDFFSAPSNLSNEKQKIGVSTASLIGDNQVATGVSTNPVFSTSKISEPFPAFCSNESTDDFGDFYSYSCSDFDNLTEPGKDSIPSNLFSNSAIGFVANELKEQSPAESLLQFSQPDKKTDVLSNSNSTSEIKWTVISDRAVREFSTARSIFIKLDQLSTVKDRMLLSEYLPLKKYISALFDINDVLNKMRAASKKSLGLCIPQNDLLLSQWSELINLFLKLSLPCPPYKDPHDYLKQNDLNGHCKICHLPFTQTAENQNHSICQELYETSVASSNNEELSSLTTNTTLVDFLI